MRAICAALDERFNAQSCGNNESLLGLNARQFDFGRYSDVVRRFYSFPGQSGAHRPFVVHLEERREPDRGVSALLEGRQEKDEVERAPPQRCKVCIDRFKVAPANEYPR